MTRLPGQLLEALPDGLWVTIADRHRDFPGNPKMLIEQRPPSGFFQPLWRGQGGDRRAYLLPRAAILPVRLWACAEAHQSANLLGCGG